MSDYYTPRTKPGLKPTTSDGRTWNPWSKANLAVLRKHHATWPDATLAWALGKTVKSVRSKAHMLGLKKSKARLSKMGAENVAKRKHWPKRYKKGKA